MKIELEDGPSDNQWAAIRKAADKGDETKTFDACVDAGVDFRCNKLFILVMAAYKRVTESVKAAADAESQLGMARRELQFALRSVGDASVSMERITVLEENIEALAKQQSEAYRDKIYICGIKQRFANLLGIGPLTGPDGSKRYPPVVDDAPPEVTAELQRLNLPTNVYAPWSYFETLPIPPKPRKRVEAAAHD